MVVAGNPTKVPGTATMLYDADSDTLLWGNGKPVSVQAVGNGRVRYIDGDGMERSATPDALKKAARSGKPMPTTFHAEKTRDARETRKRKYELQKASDAKLREKMMADATDRRHGTRRGYNLGCRCGACKRAAKLDYRRICLIRAIKAAGRNPYTGGVL